MALTYAAIFKLFRDEVSVLERGVKQDEEYDVIGIRVLCLSVKH